ncbi:hypothetical protein Aperf_G00000022960 [Anoplocephala perfoliata]
MAFVPERVLECSICIQRLKDPRSLPCDHVFCRDCITDWLRTNNECPLCRKRSTLDDLKKIFFLNEILDNIHTEDKPACDACHDVVDELTKCDHCSKNICALCATEHINELKAEVRKACEKLISVTLPSLEEQETKIAILMSEASSAKTSLTTQLREAHEALLDQIAALKLKSLDTMEKMVGTSHSDLNTQIEDVENLISRIESCISKSTEILAKKDLKALVDLDLEVDRLQRDIKDFQDNQKKSNPNQMDSLKNLKINPAYKWFYHDFLVFICDPIMSIVPDITDLLIRSNGFCVFRLMRERLMRY